VTSALVEAADKSSSGGLGFIFPLLLIAMVGFLFLSTRKRKAASQQLQQALKVGSSIMTTSGLYATVIAVHDDGVVLEVAPGVHSKYARQAVSRVISSPEDEPIEHEAIYEDEHDRSIDLNKEPPGAS
jgi:preprotein translocase subunit YajC